MVAHVILVSSVFKIEYVALSTLVRQIITRVWDISHFHHFPLSFTQVVNAGIHLTH